MLEKEEIFQMYFDEIPSENLESEDKECYFYQYKKFTLKIIVSNDFPHSLPEYTFQIIRVLINGIAMSVPKGNCVIFQKII